MTIAPETTAVMAATIVRSTAVEALKFVNSATGRSPNVPILNGVLVTATSSAVRFTTFDFDVAATQVVSGTGHGKVIVGAAQLLELVKDGAKDDVLDLHFNGDKLTVASHEVVYTLATFPVEDFPALPPAGEDLIGTIPESALKRLPDVLHAASTDDTVPVLTGVRFEEHDGTLHAYASDRYRLALLDTGGQTSGRGFLIPRKVVAHVAKFTGEVRIWSPESDPQFVTFTDANGRSLTVKETEGDFPRVRRLLPAERDMPAELRVDTTTLAKAVKRASKVLSRNEPIQLHVENRGPSLTAGDDTAAARCDVPGDVLMPLEDGPIGFNAKYLSDLVAALGAGTAVGRFSTRTKPSLWHNPASPEFQVLLMPVRIQG